MAACQPRETTLEPLAPVPAPVVDPTTEILAASDLPPLVPVPLDGDDMGVTVHRLRNGLTVYISTDRQKPRFDAWIAVRTGSRNDPADSTGLAHYLEHMLFKGTDDYGTLDIEAEREHLERIEQLYSELRQSEPGADDARRAEIFAEIDRETQATATYAIPNEFDRMYTLLGIEGVNAFTSDEITAYIGDVPANRLEAWATIEAERFADPVFRLFYPELEAVYEEKNLSIDSPEDQVWESMMLGLFPAHPYGTQPTIGVVDHLKSPAYGDMVQYFEDWYAPNNMAVVLAGDIDADTALPVLERTLGRLSPRALPEPEPGSLAPIQGRVEREVIGEGEQTVSIAWRTVDVRHADQPVMVVLDWIVDNAQSGLLDLELELTQKVQDAGSWTTSLNESGYFGVEATLQQGQTHAEVEALLLGVIAKLQAGEFSDAEIEAIKLHEDISDKRTREDSEARVERMADSFISRQSWGEVLERREQLRAVTRADVIRVANQYLGDDFVVVNRKLGTQQLPNIQKPAITPIDIDTTRESPFAAEVLNMSSTPLEPEWLVPGRHYELGELPAGPMIAAANPRNDLFTLSYRFDRGHRKDKLLCVAFELIERAGAGPTPAAELQKQLFALGTSVKFGCSAESSNIEISGIDRNLEQSVDLVEQWLRSPSFDQDTIAGLRRNLISAREDQLDDPDALAWLLSDYVAHGKHAAALSAPSNAVIAKLDGKPLAKLLASVPDTRHRTLYFGPRSLAEAGPIVSLGSKHRDPGPPRQHTFRPSKPGDSGVTIYFLHKDVAKSSISLAIPQGQQPRERRPVAAYLGHYLSGDMSSLIFQEIREARGLAYYAYGYVSTGTRPDDEWGLLGGMGTQADKTADALGVYLELVRKRAIDSTRLARTLESIDVEFRSSRVDPRWVMWWVDGWLRQGDEGDPRPWEWAEIQKLGVEDVDKFAKTYAEQPVLIGIVGDRNRVDLAALAKLGEIVEVQAKDLVAF